MHLGQHTATAALALTLGASVLAVAAPANAETGAVSYACSAFNTTYPVSVNTDSTAPAKMFVGETVNLVVDSDVVLPPELAKRAYDELGGRSFDGRVDLASTIAGATPVPETIPTTQLGDQSTTATAVPFTATSAAVPFKPTLPGEIALEAGTLKANLSVIKQNGDRVALPVDCAAPKVNAKAPVIDTVQVVAKTTTELTLSPTVAGFGESVTATAKVTPTGGVADGDVTFVVDGVSTKVQVKAGLAAVEIDRATIGITPISATFTPKDVIHYEGSSATPANLKVFKAETSAKVKITGKRLRERTGATLKVVGINKTVPTGKVRLVLRKVGNKGFHKAKSGELVKGSRGFSLGRLGKGKYKVVVKYLGDSNHQDAKTIKRFRVRR